MAFYYRYKGYQIKTMAVFETAKQRQKYSRWFNPCKRYKYLILYNGKIKQRSEQSYPSKAIAILDAENRIDAVLDSL